MDTKHFRQIVHEVMLENQFVKKGSFYYRIGPCIICILGLQKSSYSRSYYINVGYVIKDLHPEWAFPRDVDSDIRIRFRFRIDGKDLDCIDLEAEVSSELLVKSLEQNIKDLIEPAFNSDGIKDLLGLYPALLYQTTVSVKKYLGIK